MADDMVASNAVKVWQWDSQLCEGKLGEILNSYKVSTMGGWEETKKLDWRSSVGAGESAQKQQRRLQEKRSS